MVISTPNLQRIEPRSLLHHSAYFSPKFFFAKLTFIWGFRHEDEEIDPNIVNKLCSAQNFTSDKFFAFRIGNFFLFSSLSFSATLRKNLEGLNFSRKAPCSLQKVTQRNNLFRRLNPSKRCRATGKPEKQPDQRDSKLADLQKWVHREMLLGA